MMFSLRRGHVTGILPDVVSRSSPQLRSADEEGSSRWTNGDTEKAAKKSVSPSHFIRTLSFRARSKRSSTQRAKQTGNGNANDVAETGSSDAQRCVTRSLSMASFFRRARTGSLIDKAEAPPVERNSSGTPKGQSRKINWKKLAASGKEEGHSGTLKTVFHRLGSLRLRNSTAEGRSVTGKDSTTIMKYGGGGDLQAIGYGIRNDANFTLPRAKEAKSRASDPVNSSQIIPSDLTPNGKEHQARTLTNQEIHSEFKRFWRSFSSRYPPTRTTNDTHELLEPPGRLHFHREPANRDLEVELRLWNDVNTVNFGNDHESGQFFPESCGMNHAERDKECGIIQPERVPSGFTSQAERVLPNLDRGIIQADLVPSSLDDLYRFNVAHGYLAEAAFVLWEAGNVYLSSGGNQLPPGEEKAWKRGKRLLMRAMEHFNRGKLWENSILICESLSKIYKAKLMYEDLSYLLQHQASLYRRILQEPRVEPQYYAVEFHGLGFPEFMRNRTFIVRTESHIDTSEFKRMIHEEFSEFGRQVLVEFTEFGILIDEEFTEFGTMDRAEFTDAEQMSDNKGDTDIQFSEAERYCKVQKLRPLSELVGLAQGVQKVPSVVEYFRTYNDVNRFEVVPAEETNFRTILFANSKLPGKSRWAEATSQIEIPL